MMLKGVSVARLRKATLVVNLQSSGRWMMSACPQAIKRITRVMFASIQIDIIISMNNMSSKYHHLSNEAQLAEITSMINRLLENNGKPVSFTENEIKEILAASKHILTEQSMMLQLEGPLKIVGNIHGHFSDLVNIFKMSGYPGDVSYLFLGDYIDKGPMSLECIILLLCYKLRHPENVFLLRGHHEVASINRSFGFYDECKERVGVHTWKLFNQVFNYLPLCALIEKKIFCVHGGLSPELQTLEQVAKIGRPLDINSNGIALDMVWSDPEPFCAGWQDNERGTSYSFGTQILSSFLKANKLELLVRSHQIVENGFQFMFNKQLVTIFSVPNFRGEYQNLGAILAVEEDLKCSFEIIKPKLKHKNDEPIQRLSPPKK